MDAIAGRYVLLEKLGQGGMGAVFRAQDRLTGQDVAIKRVSLSAPPGISQQRAALDETQAAEATPMEPTRPHDSAPLLLALAEEFRTLASIRHPHVISVLDYGFESRHRPFFTMEL